MENEGSLILEGLNSAQKEAVMNLMGPSLIIAGAGSGKTKVLTCKIANILSHGFAPWSVLALTFTNKAAREMRSRIGKMIGERIAYRLWMGTFHSIFLRFLREYAALLGFPPGFTIYDKSDQKSLIKQCIKELRLDDTLYKPGEISSRISECKSNFITADAYTSHFDYMESDRRTRRGRLHEVFSLYQEKCVQQGVMDFDDILLNTYRLITDFPEAYAQIKGRFQFLLVDEYQDTNNLQYLILKALAADHQNITVVGDDAQSIYAFRGARIENILNFKRDYPSAKEFRLERNYRSTKTIVEAANSLINKNKHRLTKECYSERDQGEKIELLQAYTEQEEALLVASSIQRQMYDSKAGYDAFAVLYRTNAQSRVIEEALRRKNMPYKIYAGHSFYERAEIKSMIAYLRLIVNANDDEALKRCVNFPPRGIGATTMERIITSASQRKISICECVRQSTPEELNLRPASLTKVRDFVAGIDKLRTLLAESDAYQIVCRMDEMFMITAALRTDLSLEGQSRLDNVEEFFSSVKEFVEEGNQEYLENEATEKEKNQGVLNGGRPVVTLDLYLQNIALIADSDAAQASSEQRKPVGALSGGGAASEQDNRISLMTVHAAKGLEFPYVYVVGMEENLFPSGGLYNSSEKDIEEERRLFYVAVTRAQNGVKLSFSRSRFRHGSHENNPPSRFIREIDRQFIKNPLSGAEDFHSPIHGLEGTGAFIPRGASQGFTSRYSQREGYARQQSPAGSSQSQQRFGYPAPPQPAAPPRPRNENFVADSPLKMKKGQKVEHERFGTGTILSMSGEGANLKAVVDFVQGGQKTLLLKFAKMKILEE